MAEKDALLERSGDYAEANKRLTELKSKVKSLLLPSLNKVASVLLSQMTGGERNLVTVDEDFEILLDFIREAKIDRAGCFKYENVVHADSRDLPGHLPEEVKEERWHRFMETQAEISAARAVAQIGTAQDVIIDGPGEEAGEYLARSKADAPEIDGVVYLKSEQTLSPGDIVRANITDADAYDLYGQLS